MDPSQLPPEFQGNIGYEATATGIVCMIIGIIILCLRGLAKLLTNARAGWDDWLMIPTGIFFLALCTVAIYDPSGTGLGQHEDALLIENINLLYAYGKSLLVYINFYIACVSFPKLVLLVLFLRIFRDKPSRIAAYVLMGIVSVYFVLALFISNFMCIPIAAIWDPEITDAKCFDVLAWTAYGTVPPVILDVAVLVLPIPSLLKLKLPLRDRIGLVLTFTSGGIGTLGGIARTIVNAKIDLLADPTWAGVPLAIVGTIEATLYLIACSLPGLRPLYLVARNRGSQYGGSRRSKKSSYYSSENSTGRIGEKDDLSMMSRPSRYGAANRAPPASRVAGPGTSGMGSVLGSDEHTDYDTQFQRDAVHIPIPRPAIQITHSYEVRRQTEVPSMGTEATAMV